MYECKITFGRIIFNARVYHGFTQRELCDKISGKYCSIDRLLLSKIENNLVEVRTIDLDWLVPRIAKIFDVDAQWLEQIRQQTEPQKLNVNEAIFPIYFNDRS